MAWYDKAPISVPAGGKVLYLAEEDGLLLIEILPGKKNLAGWLKSVGYSVKTGKYGDIKFNLKLGAPETKEILDFIANALFKQNENRRG